MKCSWNRRALDRAATRSWRAVRSLRARCRRSASVAPRVSTHRLTAQDALTMPGRAFRLTPGVLRRAARFGANGSRDGPREHGCGTRHERPEPGWHLLAG